MSNRVVVIRILGLNLAGEQSAAVLTTRFHPDYDDIFKGTVVSLSDQLSSEIQVFGSMGSDSKRVPPVPPLTVMETMSSALNLCSLRNCSAAALVGRV